MIKKCVQCSQTFDTGEKKYWKKHAKLCPSCEQDFYSDTDFTKRRREFLSRDDLDIVSSMVKRARKEHGVMYG